MATVLRMLLRTSLRSATMLQVLAFLLLVLAKGYSQSAIDHRQRTEHLPSRPSAEFSHDFQGPWADVSFSPDGRSLATLGELSTKTVWDVASGQARHLLPESGSLTGACRKLWPSAQMASGSWSLQGQESRSAI